MSDRALPLTLVAIALVCSFTHLAHGQFTMTGVYDENVVATNSVDQSMGPKTVAQFTVDVATAFGMDLGGVIDFETGTSFPNAGENVVGSSFTAAFGGKTANFLTDRNVSVFQNNIAAQSSVISALPGKDNALLVSNNLGNELLLTLGPVTGGVGEVATEVGVTIVPRNVWNATGEATVTATFSNGATSSLTATLGNVPGTNDSFFHFEAPAGGWISSLHFDGTAVGGTTNQARLPIDDLAIITQAVPGAGQFIATGTYDENAVATNTVDNSVGVKSVAQFTADVSSAFAGNHGGVVDFETGTLFPNAGSNELGATFSVGYGSKTIQFTSDEDLAVWQDNVAGQVEVISAAPGKNNALMISNNAGADTFELSIDSILGGGVDEFVSEVAFTLLPRNAYDSDGTASVTAFYSDGSFELLAADLGNAPGAGDTFLFFAAPDGFAIESLLFDGSQTGGATENPRRLAIDDFAFITVTAVVPEPTSLAIWLVLVVGIAAVGLLRTRRRR